MTDAPKPGSGRISITDAARTFGVSTNTIRRRVQKGHLTPFQRTQPGGRPRYVFDVTDLIRVFGEPSARASARKVERDTDIPRNVPQSKNVQKPEVFEHAEELETLKRRYEVLKASFEAQSKHLEDLQRLLTPRLAAPQPLSHRAARYLGELARAFRGENR